MVVFSELDLLILCSKTFREFMEIVIKLLKEQGRLHVVFTSFDPFFRNGSRKKAYFVILFW